MKTRIIKISAIFASVFALFTLTSCDSVMKIQMSTEGVRFSLNSVLGKTFTETISGIMGLSDGTENGQELFNADGMKKDLTDAGFTKVNVKTKNSEEFTIDFAPSKTGADPLSKAGILKYDAKLAPYIHLSKENLKNLYDNLPFEVQSYIDMLMSPSFTGEEMTDDEYLELVASVYGQKLSDEIQKSKIDFVFVQGDKQKSMKLSLLSVLNTTGDLIIKN